MFANWFLCSRPSTDLESAVERLRTALRYLPEISDSSDLSPESLIVSLGGDGTALGAMRLSAQTGAKIIAIHAGTLGFLTDLNTDDIERIPELLPEMIDDSRQLLAWTDESGKEWMAGNEIHMADVESGKFHMWGFETSNQTPGFFSADGLLASTPTGTTAYGLSAGGSILHPWTPAFQISAVAPLSLAFRPCAVSPEEPLSLWFKAKRNGCLVLRVDGIEAFRKNVLVGEEHSFDIHPSNRKAVFLRKKGWCFFSTVSKKLGWGTIPGLKTD